MKKLIFLIVACFLTFFLTSCFSEYCEKLFEGPHELRKMKESPVGQGIQGSFFLGCGSVTGGKISQEILFSWRTFEGEYIFSQFPYEKIRLRFNEQREIPVIYFIYEDWRDCQEGQIKYNSGKIGQVIQTAIIECKREHWGLDITLPMQSFPIPIGDVKE